MIPFVPSMLGRSPATSGTAYSGNLLLEGDEQSGTDVLLLEGDEQSGTDHLALEGNE